MNKNDTTWSATQVGPRPVEAGLGGREEGVWGVDEGVEDASTSLRKRGRMALSVCPTFSDFIGVGNQNDSENQNTRRHVVDNDTLFVKIIYFCSSELNNRKMKVSYSNDSKCV